VCPILLAQLLYRTARVDGEVHLQMLSVCYRELHGIVVWLGLCEQAVFVLAESMQFQYFLVLTSAVAR
jgi:hypothetical protein